MQCDKNLFGSTVMKHAKAKILERGLADGIREMDERGANLVSKPVFTVYTISNATRESVLFY